MYANYVWSKTLGNIEYLLEGENSGSIDYYNLKPENSATFDTPTCSRPTSSTISRSAKARPYGLDTNKWVNGLIGGSAVSAIFNYFSGTPGSASAARPPPAQRMERRPATRCRTRRTEGQLLEP